MDRRRTVKMIKTPDTSTIAMDDNTLLFNTPQKKKPAPKPTILTSPFNPPAILTDYKPYIINIVLFSLIAIQYYRNDKNEVFQLQSILESLLSENTDLKNKYKEISQKLECNKQLVDYASIENGAFINYKNTSTPYKYGLFRKSYKDPSIVLYSIGRAGECFAFTGQTGILTIMFKESILIEDIVIAHPMTDDRRSAVNKFHLYGLCKERKVSLGKYNFELNDRITQKYDIHGSEMYEGIIMEIENNHGKERYTCVYKISVNGYAYS